VGDPSSGTLPVPCHGALCLDFAAWEAQLLQPRLLLLKSVQLALARQDAKERYLFLGSRRVSCCDLAVGPLTIDFRGESLIGI